MGKPTLHRLGGDASDRPGQKIQGALLKEALHIQMTPAEERFNRDGGLEIPGCWIVALKTLEGGAGLGQLPASSHMYP